MSRLKVPTYLCLIVQILIAFSLYAESPISLEERLKSYIHYSESDHNRIGYIAIDDKNSSINQSTWLYVKQALDYYKDKKPAFIILKLNTPGGEIFAAEQISDALIAFDTQQQIPIVAYIDNWAISAGALLAYSCRFITVVKEGSMGAAQPVMLSAEGQTQAASEKVNSALRADFANRAHFFDRDPNIAEAMVDADIILVWRNGKVVRLNSESQIQADDEVITPKGKLLTLNAQQLVKYGVADLLLAPMALPPMTTEEEQSGKWPANKLALFHQPFFKDIPQAEIDAYTMDWKTRFFVWLASPMISSALFLGLMVGIYFEMSSPGIGFPAALATLCLFLLILSTYSLQLASWLEVIFIAAGVALVLLEIFFIPSGLLGLVGGALMLAGLVGILLPELNDFTFDWDNQQTIGAADVILERLGWLSAAIILGCVIIILASRYIKPSFAGLRRLVLSGSEQEGYTAAEPQKNLAIGMVGLSASVLRPAGKVLIQDKLYDAFSSGDYIAVDRPVKVVGFDGPQLIVQEVKEE